MAQVCMTRTRACSSTSVPCTLLNINGTKKFSKACRQGDPAKAILRHCLIWCIPGAQYGASQPIQRHCLIWCISGAYAPPALPNDCRHARCKAAL
eukprot:1139809-Pelagomonas_calceolata.AAC.3